MKWYQQGEDEEPKRTRTKKTTGPDPHTTRQIPCPDSAPPSLFEDFEDFEDDVIDEIYDWVGRVRAKGPQFRGKLLHVSKLHNLCSRIAVFKKAFPELDIPETIRASLQMTFDFGTSTHDWWQNKYLGTMGWLWGDWKCTRCYSMIIGSVQPNHPCRSCNWSNMITLQTKAGTTKELKTCREECRWPGGFYAEDRHCGLCNRWGSWSYQEPGIYDEELGLVGHCDGICFPKPGTFPIDKFALEMKTKTKEMFDKLSQPEPNHVLQINTYMHYLKLMHGVIIYIHKGEYDEKKGNKPKVYHIEYDFKLAQQALNAARAWRRAEKSGIPGDRVCHSESSWQAKRCPFHSVCYQRDINDQVKKILESKSA